MQKMWVWSGRSPGEGNSNPVQCSCLENPIQRSLEGYSPWGRKKLDTTEQLIWRKKVNCVSSSFSNPGSFNLSNISERYMSFPTISLWALWAESEAWSSHSWFIIELLFEPSASLESCLWDVYTFMSMSIHRQVMSMKLLTGVGGLPFYPMCPL